MIFTRLDLTNDKASQNKYIESISSSFEKNHNQEYSYDVNVNVNKNIECAVENSRQVIIM